MVPITATAGLWLTIGDSVAVEILDQFCFANDVGRALTEGKENAIVNGHRREEWGKPG